MKNYRIDGSVVELSPATLETGVRFQVNAEMCPNLFFRLTLCELTIYTKDDIRV